MMTLRAIPLSCQAAGTNYASDFSDLPPSPLPIPGFIRLFNNSCNYIIDRLSSPLALLPQRAPLFFPSFFDLEEVGSGFIGMYLVASNGHTDDTCVLREVVILPFREK